MVAIGRPELRTDPRFNVNSARIAHIDKLDAIIAAWIGERTRAEVMALLDQAEVAVAPINDIPDVFANEHFQARESFTAIEDPDLGIMHLVNVVPRFSQTPGRVLTTGPDLGQHNAEVYGEIGLEAADLEMLARDGII